MCDMLFLFSLILILCKIASGFAAHYSGSYIDPASYIGHYVDPAYPGKCVLNGLILSPGEVHYDLQKCERTSCSEHIITSYYSCGVYSATNGCKIGDRIHPHAAYPDCCQPHIICNNV